MQVPRSPKSTSREMASAPTSSASRSGCWASSPWQRRSPLRKPVQAALISRANRSSGSPSSRWTRQAVLGTREPGEKVATSTAPISSRPRPAFSSCSTAARAAPIAREVVSSSGPANRRCRMPVRVAIHWSLVSTSFARWSLVTTCAAGWLPVAMMLMPVICSPSFSPGSPSAGTFGTGAGPGRRRSFWRTVPVPGPGPPPGPGRPGHPLGRRPCPPPAPG